MHTKQVGPPLSLQLRCCQVHLYELSILIFDRLKFPELPLYFDSRSLSFYHVLLYTKYSLQVRIIHVYDSPECHVFLEIRIFVKSSGYLLH